MGASDQEITLDMVICGGYGLTPPSHPEGYNTIENWQIKKDIKKYYGTSDAVSEEIRSAPGVNVRYYFQEGDICGLSELDFDGADTWCLQEAGR